MHWVLLAVIVSTVVQGCISQPLENGGAGFFWHITDIHVDQNYSRTGNPKDLCHEGNASSSDNGLYGNFLCDSPIILANVTVQAMRRIKHNPDFILWTGDNLPHTTTFDPDWNVIYEGLNNITILFDSHFPGIPVFPCIGNHDTFPPNMLLPNDSSNSIYKDILIKGGWNKYLNEEETSTFIKGGYYSQLVEPGFRIISLNTILWYSPNHFTEKMDDPANQFQWLEAVLENCSKSSEKVLIIGHVPPGFYNRAKPDMKATPTYHPQHLNAYLEILKKFSYVIGGQIFGHLHMDMFQIFLLGSGHFMSSSLLASSVTPWHFISPDNISLPVNPSIRLLQYDSKSALLKDFHQFYLNLEKANNNSKESENLYELLYTFTKAYDVPDLSTKSLIEVFEKIKANDSLFDMFYKFSTAGKESVICDNFCKVTQLCSISSISIDEYEACMKVTSSNVVCHENNEHAGYSNIFPYAIATIISCISIVLLFFLYQKYRRSDNELYTKLLRDF